MGINGDRVQSGIRKSFKQRNKVVSSLAAAVMATLGLSTANATTVYWDTNGATADSSGTATANGTWNMTSTGNWSTDVTGASATTDYTSASGTPATAAVVFSAGSNATGSTTITLDAASLTTGIVAGSITIEDGAIATATTNTGNLVGPLLTVGSGITLASTAAGASSFNSNTSFGLSASQSWTNSNTTAANSLSAAGTIVGTATSGTTTLNLAGVNTGNNTLSGIIGNGTTGATLAISKTGAGTWILSNANTYSGGTTVSEGTLLVGNAAGAGAGTVTLGGGTFGASGAQTIANTVSANASTTTTLQGTGTLTLTGTLTGSGTINLGAIGANLENTSINSTNSSKSGGFTGTLSVGGTLGFNSPASANGADYYYNLSNAAVTLASGGSMQWNAANGSATNNPGVLYVNLGSLSSASGIGTIGTVSGGSVNTKMSRYVVGTLNTDATYGGVIASGGNLGTALTKVGTGTLILTGTNTYAGTAAFGTFAAMPASTIRGGTLQVGDGTSGSLASTGALTFGDTGRFNYQGQTAGSSQSLGALTFGAGAGTVQSTYGTSGNTSLTFSNVVARAAGATANFVVSGGTNGSTNKIVFTQIAGVAPTAGALIDRGYYFGGTDFAAYDSGGYVRALAYGSDANSAAVDTITASNNVKLSSAVTGQAGISLLTLNLSGSGTSWANSASQTLTLAGGGLIKSGAGTAATLSGGTGVTTGGATELVVRTDVAADSLDIQANILSSSTGGLTKAGVGTLILSAGTNAYTGATRVNEGTLIISGAYSGSSAFTVNNSATLTVTGTLTSTAASAAMTVGNGSGNGILNVNSGGTVNLNISSGNTGLQISNSSTGYDTGSGTVNVAGTLNTTGDIYAGLGGTQTGTLNISNGGIVNLGTTTLRWLQIGSFDESNGVVNLANGGTVNLSFNSDIRFSTNGGSGTSVFNQNGGNVTVWSGNGTGTTGSATDGLIDMQNGSTTVANNTYNLNGGTLLVNQVKSTNTNGTRTFNFNGGTLKAFSASAGTTFFNLGTGNARANVRNGGGTINNNVFNVTVAQALLHSNISGDAAIDGGMAFSGSGTTTLTGANTYTGLTSISSGTTVATSATGTVGAGSVAIAGTGKLTLVNTGSIADSAVLTFSDTSVINLNAASGSESVTSLFDSTTSTTFNTLGTYTAAQLNTIFNNSVFTSGSGETITVVPEPASLALLGLASSALLGRRSRKSRVGSHA